MASIVRRRCGDCVEPEVAGTLFRVAALPVGSSGTQTVVAAIRDAAGNMGYATNRFVADVCTNGLYSYDAAGNVTNIEYRGTATTESRAFVWNARGELLSATFGAETESYQYDALGRRIAIVSNDVDSALIYEGPHVAQERDAGGVDKRSYDYGPGIDWLLGYGDFTDGVLCGYFRCITDIQGTVHAIVDESGTIVERYEYDAWGRVLGVYDGSGVPLQRTACGNRYLFQGREYSWVSGLYYFRARWYDPVTGRWMSKDPIGIGGGLNQYGFCAENPVNHVDPYGLDVHIVGITGNLVAIVGADVTVGVAFGQDNWGVVLSAGADAGIGFGAGLTYQQYGGTGVENIKGEYSGWSLGWGPFSAQRSYGPDGKALGGGINRQKGLPNALLKLLSKSVGRLLNLSAYGTIKGKTVVVWQSTRARRTAEK